MSIPACRCLSKTSSNPFSSGYAHNTHYPHYGRLPHPFNTFYTKASTVIPWRDFFLSYGLFPVSLDHTSVLGTYVYISLACLDAEGLSLAHGEFVGMSLVQEDILQTSNLAISESPMDLR